MLVKATKVGDYLGLRQPGDVFVLIPRKTTATEDAKSETLTPASQFSKRWMVKIDKNGGEKATPSVTAQAAADAAYAEAKQKAADEADAKQAEENQKTKDAIEAANQKAADGGDNGGGDGDNGGGDGDNGGGDGDNGGGDGDNTPAPKTKGNRRARRTPR